MSQCPVCGFALLDVRTTGGADGVFDCVYDETMYHDAAAAIRQVVACATELLRNADDSTARHRPEPDRWSALEYSCHLRDVLIIQRERVLRALRGFGHERIAMGRDERVEDDAYNEQELNDVAIQLEQTSVLFDGLLDRMTGSDWNLSVNYMFPDPSPRSLRWVAVHTAHEATHHLHDISVLLPR